MIATSASPIPVFPEVPSIMVPPGCKRPSASASSTIFKAMRSFVEFPGLNVSYFAKTNAGMSLTSLFILTIGVFPMVPSMFSAYSISFILSKSMALKPKNCVVQRYVLQPEIRKPFEMILTF